MPRPVHDTDDSPTFLRRRPEIAAQVQAILGLPDSRWITVHVEFGNEEPATVVLKLLPTPYQLAALASIALDDAQRRLTERRRTHEATLRDLVEAPEEDWQPEPEDPAPSVAPSDLPDLGIVDHSEPRVIQGGPSATRRRAR